MTSITAAFLGVAHIHTPGFIDHLKPLREAGEVSIKYVWDRDEARAKSVAEKLGAATAKSVDAVLADPEITAVVICSETVFHKDLVLAAVAAGKNVFAEKPLGISGADANAMADAIERSGVVFQTGFFSRCQPTSQFIKREVAAGRLGKLIRAHYSVCHGGAALGWFDTEWAWFAKPELSGGGALLDLGAHALDLIINTFTPTEGAIVKTHAALANRAGTYGGKIDEYGTALLVFESGFEATIEASWVDRSGLYSPTSIYGTEGAFLEGPDGLHYQSDHVAGADGKTALSEADLPKLAPHAFRLYWERLLDRPLPVPLVSVREAALGSAVMERLYKSAGAK